MINEVARRLFQVVFRGRKATRRAVARFAVPYRDARILELGSGKAVEGAYSYSCADLFDASNDVMMSDANPSFGHSVVDCTTMEFESEFDAILCANVLEHVYEFDQAVKRIHRALRPGGRVLVIVPMFFPLHDEPHDFWRFTEHSLKRMLSPFAEVVVRHRGPRRAPLAYFVTATK